MDNPFERRATELVRSEEAFLALVSPEPLDAYLKSFAVSGRLYDRLVVLLGTPGSGKTTIGKLYEYPMITTLLRHGTTQAYRELLSVLSDLRAVKDGHPLYLGCRIPMESDYREIWEFPYPPELRDGLLKTFIQSRTVLLWFRHLRRMGYEPKEVTAVVSGASDAAAEAIGGTAGESILRRAQAVESAVYEIVGSLVPPPVSEIDIAATEAYRPFDVIEAFVVEREGDVSRTLVPMVILDDAHSLHPTQFSNLLRWLARRELRIARWVLTRLDVLAPEDAIASILTSGDDSAILPGVTPGREITTISLQRASNRRESRVKFRRIARDMANRYLSQMPQFASRRLEDLSALLSDDSAHLSQSRLKDLEAATERVQRTLHISNERRQTLSRSVEKYAERQPTLLQDDKAQILQILMHRYAKRVPQGSLFGGEADPEPAKPLLLSVEVCEAARLRLLHEEDRAFFFGIEDLCDASSENAEQFLRMTSILIEALSVRLVRGRPPFLTATEQHELLTKRATQFIRDWSFPRYERVKELVDYIADRCLVVSMAPNAWIGAGANAYGVLQDDFDSLVDASPALARILQYAVAYNAITLVPKYECKSKVWCLLELGGIILLERGLTLRRGGFVEGSLEELALMTGSRLDA